MTKFDKVGFLSNLEGCNHSNKKVVFCQYLKENKIIETKDDILDYGCFHRFITKNENISQGSLTCNENLQYEYSKTDISLCPTISNVELDEVKFSSSMFTNENALIGCIYRYKKDNLTSQSINDCNKAFPGANSCSEMLNNYCSIKSNEYSILCFKKKQKNKSPYRKYLKPESVLMPGFQYFSRKLSHIIYIYVVFIVIVIIIGVFLSLKDKNIIKSNKI